jgi:predicted dehydrogenase
MLTGAFVGFGNVAEFGHWPAYASSGQCGIVAAVERVPERRAAAERFGLETFSSLADLTNRRRIDFVDICTPPAEHYSAAAEALRHGCHVLCEKPVFLHLREFDQVRELARAAGVAVAPVHNWKYAPIIRCAAQSMHEGTIGALRKLTVTTLRSNAASTAGHNWRKDARLAGGGILMDHGWHAVYLALTFFAERPLDLTCELHRPSPQSAEDEAFLRLAFPSGVAEIVLSWNAQRRANELQLCGDRGEIKVMDDVLAVNGDTKKFESALSAGSHHPDWFAAMLPDVVAAFGVPGRSAALLAEATECLRTISAAYEQAKWRTDG